MKVYSFFNSSASYRVRIALALKGIDYQTVGVNIRIGQQNALAYRRMNPVGLIPQWANALRMGCDLSGYPRCKAVYDACVQLPAFIAAAPENQQDKIPA
ncbi:hypothetical protein GFI14_11710 [Salmonella enterica subsp. arizonae]|nr:hypothetical protein [Salmonella enterica subsp. arizonae]